MNATAQSPRSIHTAVFLIVGAGLVVYGLLLALVTSPRVQAEAEHLPHLTCKQLLRQGPGPHPYVILSGARLGSHGFVLERDWENGNLRELLQPIYPADLKEEPPPRDLALILRICDDREVPRLLEQPNPDQFTCGVSRGPAQLEPELCEALARKYPGLRWEKCWVVSVGLHEPRSGRAQGIFWTGIGMEVVGVLVLAWPARRLLRERLRLLVSQWPCLVRQPER
jgi:hypothetical protein